MASRPPRFSAEGIYRRVSVRMYGDAKFAALSPMQPSGQALWLYILTGPHTGPIPGVFVIGRAAMAEALGWSTKAFDQALAEVIAQGMVEVDAKARLWFVPQALKHNPPASPNVVRSWRAQWAVLPECELRDRIAEAIGEGFGEAYSEAFAEACGKPSPETTPKPLAKPLAKPSPKAHDNQEQEQDTGVESTSVLSARATSPSPNPEPRSPPSPAGAVGLALKRGGLAPGSLNLADPRLTKLIAEGATPEEFEGLAREAVERGIAKPLGWICATLQGRREEAASITLAQQPEDPMAWRRDSNAVLAKGEELGVKFRPGELINAYTDRVVQAYYARRPAQGAAV